MSETKADWELAWESNYPGAAEKSRRSSREFLYDSRDMRDLYRDCYLAATEARSPGEAGVVTSEHRLEAWWAMYDVAPTAEAMRWIEQSDFGIPSPNTALRRIAQALATRDRMCQGASGTRKERFEVTEATLNLNELEATEKAATPGPWLHPIEDEPRLISGPDGAESLLGLTSDGEAIVFEQNDARLIVAMRNGLSALIAEVRAARASLLAVHDLSSARLNGANKLSSWEYWEHDMREIERISREG